VINPKAIADGRDLALNPGSDAGSGPYVLTQLLPNNKAVYAKAPQTYWQKGYQNLAHLEIIGIADYTAAQNALQAGQLDASYQRADIDQLKQIAGRGFKLYDYVPLGAESLWLRNTREQLSNPLVRQAIASAIDRKSIEDGLLKGDCVDTSQIFPKGYPLYVSGLDPYPFNPDKAKQLLQQAGAMGMPLNMVSANVISNQLEQVFQQQLNAVGFKATVTQGTSAQGTAAFAAGQIDARETVASLASADPIAVVDQFYLAGGQFNLGGTEAATLQGLRNKAADPKTSDSDRQNLYQQMGKEITDQAWIVPVCFSKSHILANPKILNLDNLLYSWTGTADVRRLAVAA
jgi:peptide/nickel transport system substrate-binding protein